MNDRELNWMYLAVFIAIGLGGAIPLGLLDYDVSDSLIESAQDGMKVAGIFFCWWGLGRLCSKYPEFEEFVANKKSGILLAAFTVACFISLLGELFYIPGLPGWLHLAISILLGAIAAALAFGQSIKNNY